MTNQENQRLAETGNSASVHPIVMSRPSGDYRLYQEQVKPLVNLIDKNNGIGRELFECPHMIAPIHRYESGRMRLEGSEQVREYAMCPECYQRLRKAGVAQKVGTWEQAT